MTIACASLFFLLFQLQYNIIFNIFMIVTYVLTLSSIAVGEFSRPRCSELKIPTIDTYLQKALRCAAPLF